MGRLCEFMALGLLCAFLGVHRASADTPFITLYRGRNMTDFNISFNASHPNFYEIGLINQIHSFRCHGNFILYDFIGYNDGLAHSRNIPMMHSQDSTITEGTDASLVAISSVRFIGSYKNGKHVPSITLFLSPYFSGEYEEVITGNQAQLKIAVEKGFIISAISVGVNDWTFYDEINYSGVGHCLKGSSDYTGVKYYNDTRYEGFTFLILKKSVEVGCWAKHGVPME